MTLNLPNSIAEQNHELCPALTVLTDDLIANYERNLTDAILIAQR